MHRRSLFFGIAGASASPGAPVRPLLEALPGGVMYVGVDLRVLIVNDEVVRLLGRTEADLVGCSVAELASAMFGEDSNSAPACPITRALTTGESQGPLTAGMRRPDGTTAWTLVRVVVERDSTSTIVGAIATFLDITERKRAEDELRQREATWRLLAENLPDFLVMLDLEARIESVNRVAPEYTHAQVVGTPGYEFCHPDHRATWKANFDRALETAEPVHFESRGESDVVATWYEQALIPLLDVEGKRVERVLCVVRDITERRKMIARLAEKERVTSVGMLSASVAHEIMNPLTSVLANLDFALSERCPPGARRTKAIIDAREGAARMQQIVRDLRALGRADTEDLFYVDVRSVLEMALRLAGPEVARNVDLRIELHEVPGVFASESLLCQVFINLVVNAVQSMVDVAPDDRRVFVRTRHDEPTSMVGVEIGDTGSGIAPEHLKRIFDPFFTTKESGTGLGLSISRESVEKMGGRIDVTSEVNRGTTFTVWLSTTRHAAPRERDGVLAAEV